MSQAKVEEHKEEKLHRKEIVKKQRRNRFIGAVVAVAICCAAVIWIGWSLYGTVKSSQEEASKDKQTVVTPVDMSALSDYASSILKDSSSSN
ncbi:MAG: hypothetical protein PUF16_00600 [Lachnospiraceae bacterium]|nr:hypothetical protein [Lachnospiraceae bacterium]